MSFSERFEKKAKKYGFRIRKVPFLNDVLSVKYRNHHIMTIPRKLYGFPNLYYRDAANHVQPDYFDREHRLKNWNFIIKRTPHIENYERDFPWEPFGKPL
jgi:hypothetical protein